jgi:predicted RNA polymerase sigma factor
VEEAADNYARALELTNNESEKRFLEKQMRNVREASKI